MSNQKYSKTPSVAVLLATSNPSEYIEDQIESIRLQKNVRTVIYWGDYKSSTLIREKVRKLLVGLENHEYEILESGPAANFFFLLKQSKEEYIAFADQDDVWLPNKLANQVQLLLKSSETPSLAHSNSDVLQGDKRLTKLSNCKNHDFFSLAVTNCCQGCTIMINNAARQKILSSLPEKIVWHDWWIALVISLTGHVYLERSTEVLYRIHKKNTIGIPRRWNRIKNYLNRPSGLIAYQIEEAINRFVHEDKNHAKEYSLLREMTSINRTRRLLSNLRYAWNEGGNFDEVLHRIAWIIKRP
jgi:hypothetical protein